MRYFSDSESESDLDIEAVVPQLQATRKRKKSAVVLKMEDTIHKQLSSMGIKRPIQTSKCVKKAIYNGFIKISGDPKELEMVISKGKGSCGHTIEATLQDLLKQPDYVHPKYEADNPNATVFCTHKINESEANPFNLHKAPDHESRWSSKEGRGYVNNLCSGNPSFDSGQSHHHCGKCPHFGVCIGDYKETHCERCQKHYLGVKCSWCSQLDPLTTDSI